MNAPFVARLGDRLAQITRIQDVADHLGRNEPPLISYREVEPACRTPPPPPRFMFGPSNAFVARQFHGQIDLRSVGCLVIIDAAVAPTGIAIKDEVAFCGHALNHPRPHVMTVVNRVNAQKMPVRFVEGPVVPFFGPAHETYGHFLVDYLPRLWVLAEAGFALDHLKILVPRQVPRISLEILQAIGIGSEQLVEYAFWDEVIRTDLLVLPTILRTYERLSPCFARATRFWTEKLPRPAAAAAPDAKIYLSRSCASGTRALVNRLSIEAIAERRGFRIVSPETLPFIEQVALLSGATQIAGEYGSALHGAVFARPGTLTCALRGTLRDPGCIQTNLGAALGQQTGYVFGSTEGCDRDQHFTVDPADFRRAMEFIAAAG